MYGEILDPNLPFLGCKTLRGFGIENWPSGSPNITLRRRLATGLACPARAFGGPSYYTL